MSDIFFCNHSLHLRNTSSSNNNVSELLLEYGVPIWFPYKMKDIEEVEFQVQKRATKQVKSLRGLPYEQRLRKLNLPTLQ